MVTIADCHEYEEYGYNLAKRELKESTTLVMVEHGLFELSKKDYKKYIYDTQQAFRPKFTHEQILDYILENYEPIADIQVGLSY
jgi:hypothetical protein